MAMISTRAVKKHADALRSFFGGNLYPFLIAFAVLLGYVTGFEFYLNILIVCATCVSLFVCDSIKPFLPTLLVIVFQINTKHTPGTPTWSDYYITGHRLVIAIILIIFIAVAILFYFIKNVIPKLSFKKSPALIPTAILSVAFILNGAFSDRWVIGDMIFGVGEAAIFFLLFYFLYYGLEKEDTGKLLDHVSYLSLLVAMVLIGELVFVYLTNDKVLIDGFIHKEELLFGWTVNNPFGFHLTILIPPLMRGAMKIKRLSLFYFLAAVLVWAGAILTLSRNAWIFSTLSFAACLIIACFCSETKWLFRSLTLIAVIIGIFGIIIFKDKLTEIFARVINAGLTDNGRYNLWRQSFQNLKEAPVFGYGFYGFGENDVYVTVDFLPTMAHNTVFQLISAMGAVGLLSYAYYRISTLVPLFKKFSYEKLMLYITVFVTLGASLLDNFIFYFIDAFHYALSLAIIFKLHREAKENDEPLKSI